MRVEKKAFETKQTHSYQSIHSRWRRHQRTRDPRAFVAFALHFHFHPARLVGAEGVADGACWSERGQLRAFRTCAVMESTQRCFTLSPALISTSAAAMACPRPWPVSFPPVPPTPLTPPREAFLAVADHAIGG